MKYQSVHIDNDYLKLYNDCHPILYTGYTLTSHFVSINSNNTVNVNTMHRYSNIVTSLKTTCDMHILDLQLVGYEISRNKWKTHVTA